MCNKARVTSHNIVTPDECGTEFFRCVSTPHGELKKTIRDYAIPYTNKTRIAEKTIDG